MAHVNSYLTPVVCLHVSPTNRSNLENLSCGLITVGIAWGRKRSHSKRNIIVGWGFASGLEITVIDSNHQRVCVELR